MGYARYNTSDGISLIYNDYAKTKNTDYWDAYNENYEKHRFDRDKYDRLIANFEYTAAADYADDYHWTDPKKDRIFHQTIDRLRTDGRKLEAEFSRIENEDDKNAVKFYRGFNTDMDFSNTDNPWMRGWNELKTNFGGRDAVSLEFVFGKKQRKLLGMDWAYADNNLNFDNFLESSGMSIDELRNAGIQIRTLDDGGISMRLNKTNKLANKILYDLGTFTESYGYGGIPLFDGSTSIKIKGYDINNREVSNHRDYLANDVVSHVVMASPMASSIRNESTDKGNTFLGVIKDALNSLNPSKAIQSGDLIARKMFSEPRNESMLSQFKNYVDNAKTINDKVSAPQNVAQTYSSTVGPALSDDLDKLTKLYEMGQMKPNDYYKAREYIIGELEGMLGRIGTHNYEMYSNMNNKEFTDMTQEALDNKSKVIWQNYFRSVDPKNISYGTQVVNGRIGLLITIDPASIEGSDDRKTTLTKKFGDIDTNKVIKLWMPEPDFAMTALKNAIGSDTKIRAVKELGDMNNYNYEYTTMDGRTIKPDMNGEYDFFDKQRNQREKIDYDRVIKELNVDMSIRDAVTYLPYHYVDRDNDITYKSQSFGNYEDAVWQWAIKTSNEIYPNIPFMDEAGNQITDPEEIINIIRTNNQYWLQYELKNKYNLVKHVYDNIMNNTNKFVNNSVYEKR